MDRSEPLQASAAEMMAVAASGELHDGELAVVGIGLPQLAADLAKLTHAPNLTYLSEIGVVDPQPGGEPGLGNADPRLWRGAVSFTGFTGVMGYALQRGRVDVGFLGALEVDPDANVNLTEVAMANGAVRRFGGSGGGNDIASHARRIVVVCRHDRRKLVERVHYITCSGRHTGRAAGKPFSIVTDMGVIRLEDQVPRLESVHHGVDVGEVVATTGFDLDTRQVGVADPPSEAQLRLLRERLDPAQHYLATADPVVSQTKNGGPRG